MTTDLDADVFEKTSPDGRITITIELAFDDQEQMPEKTLIWLVEQLEEMSIMLRSQHLQHTLN